MTFKNPAINLYVEDIERSESFYSLMGFEKSFEAVVEGKVVHIEMKNEGFTLGIASKVSAESMHGLETGPNKGFELVFWVEDVDSAFDFMISIGASPVTQPHNFIEHNRAAWIKDPDGNTIQLVMHI